MRASDIAAPLKAKKSGNGKWTAKCPAHNDEIPSLSISDGLGGRVLLKCHAGCELKSILAALNLTFADISGTSTSSASKPRTIVAEYNYRDQSGKVVYQAVRYANPKGFAQRQPDGNSGWKWNMDGVPKIPFNLPELLRSNTALIAEGEKDALNLQKAAADFPTDDGKIVYAATTNIGGAEKWLEQYSPHFAGRDVYVFPDNDETGRKHAKQICASVAKYAKSVHLVELPGLPDRGDVSDYLMTHSPADLFALMESAPLLTPHLVAIQQAISLGDLSRITGELLETTQAWIRRYIVATDEQVLIMAAWILHTYTFDAAETTPYIHIAAPDKECGKSRLMETLAAIAARPIRSGGMTAAALVRTIEAMKPTIFLDEMDAQLGGDKDFAETIRGILNEGFRRGGTFFKCVGKDFELKAFNVFCPKCLAGIGHLPETVSSRSIVIEMRRKLPEEAVESFRQRAVEKAAQPIRKGLDAWASPGTVALLQAIQPAPIEGLGDRQNDIAEPLLCIAQLAGEEWLRKITQALQRIFNTARVDESSIGTMLLADIRSVFDHVKKEQIPSNELANELCKIEGRPWADWSHGRGMSPNNLALQLRKYNIHPQTIRVGGKTPKGYRREMFEEVWSRYCPLPPSQNATPQQSACLLTETAFPFRNTIHAVAVPESVSNPHEQGVVAAVAVQDGEGTKLEVRV